MSLEMELQSLPDAFVSELTRSGFDRLLWARLASTLSEGDVAERRERRNRVEGPVSPPSPGEILDFPDSDSSEACRLRDLGAEALRRGEVAVVVMAGGMATRMGGVVKALVEACEGHTFLDLRLQENVALAKKYGRPVPLWLMTSAATDEPIVAALKRVQAPAHVRTFRQGIGLRFAPDGRLFRDASGNPSTYATGHGDLIDALRSSGLLREFIAQGGRVVWIANLDNVGASVDPVILGQFLDSSLEVLVEVCDKVEGDRGGIPVHAQGRLQVLEEFRLPKTFDAKLVSVFNTNTFLVRAKTLESVNVPWNWFEVEKRVDGRVAIQFERLIQEITGVVPSGYLRVPRDGEASRFLPVKDDLELERRRGVLASVARSRFMLEPSANE